MVPQKTLRVFPSLSQSFSIIRIPGAGLFYKVCLHAQVQNVAFPGYAASVDDIEFDLAERGRYLVLDDLYPGTVTDNVLTFLDRTDPSDVEPHGGVELERVASRRSFGRAVHDPYFHSDLVGENNAGLRLTDSGYELAERLAHKPRLEPDVRIAHLAFDFGFRDECGNRIDHYDVNGVTSDQNFGDFKRLLAVVGLTDQKFFHPDPQLSGIRNIQGMLGVHKGCQAPKLLRLGDDVQRQGGFSGRLRAEYLDNAAPWDAADPQRDIQRQTAARYDGYIHNGAFPEAHNGALPTHAFYLGNRRIDGSLPVIVRSH